MNKIILMGRLTKEPDIYDKVTRFRIAVNRRFKTQDGQDADFFNCACFGKTKEFADSYLTKGIKIIVEGRLQNGHARLIGDQNVETNDVIVESMEFAESKKQESEGFQRVDEATTDALPFD